MNDKSHRQKHLLLVYDHSQQCEILEEQLEMRGFKVHTCRSLQTAAMMMEAAQGMKEDYHWLVIHHDFRETSDLDSLNTPDQQIHERLNIIYFHHCFRFENLSRFSNRNSHILPLKSESDLAAAVNAICRIISQTRQEDADDSRDNDRQKRILLVEDNEIGRLMAKELLEYFGLHVSEAENGAEAIEKVRHNSYDLILTDLLMPVMNGFDAIKCIREDLCRDVPIIAVSANAEDSWADSMSAGASGYLVKPFAAQKLLDELRKWISLPDQHEEQVAIKENPSPLAPLSAYVDITKGVARAGGNSQFYVRLLSRYVDDFTDFESRFRTALADNAMSEAVHLVHSLKGAAGGIAAQHLAELAGRIERQLRAGDQLRDLSVFFNENHSFIQAILSLPELGDHDTDTDLEQGSAAELFDSLSQLKKLLKTHQAQSIKEQARYLTEKKWPAQFKEGLDNLQEQLAAFQYPGAIAMVNQLLANIQESSINPDGLS